MAAAKRINLCNPVRNALVASGYSTVKVVNAVNAALGQLDTVGAEAKTGDGRVSKDGYKVTVTETTKLSGARCNPLNFDAWHSAVAKAFKVAEFDSVSLPLEFKGWLDSMKDAPVTQPAVNA